MNAHPFPCVQPRGLPQGRAGVHVTPRPPGACSTEKHAAAACQFPRCQRCLFRRRDASHGSRVGVPRLDMARSDLSTGHAGPPAGFPTRSPSPLGVDPRATVRHTWQISGREGDGFEISGRRRAPVRATTSSSRVPRTVFDRPRRDTFRANRADLPFPSHSPPINRRAAPGR